MGDRRLGPALALGVRKNGLPALALGVRKNGIRSLTVAALIVGTLLAAANPAFAQSGGGYNIKKSTIDGGGVTFHTGGAYRLGGTVGQHDAGNLSGGGYKLTGGFWSPVAAPGNIVWDANDLSTDRTTRSLRFRVEGKPNGSLEDAIRVELVELQNPVPANAPCCPPPNFGAYESATCTAAGESGGCARWVGKPGTFLESQDDPSGPTYRAARLQCSPFYFDWITETTTTPITVVGAEIMPSSTYSVQTYGASCKGVEAGCTNVSTPAQMLTRRSGDVAARFNPPDPSTQPDAIDVTQLVNKFKNVPGAPIKPIAQLQPNLPELNADINALDIVAVVDGVKGFAYSFAGPCPCPSAVTCGGSCTGCSGMCVKTCSGSGDPCITNGHCPTGETCGNPLCRDSCGRCTP